MTQAVSVDRLKVIRDELNGQRPEIGYLAYRQLPPDQLQAINEKAVEIARVQLQDRNLTDIDQVTRTLRKRYHVIADAIDELYFPDGVPVVQRAASRAASPQSDLEDIREERAIEVGDGDDDDDDDSEVDDRPEGVPPEAIGPAAAANPAQRGPGAARGPAYDFKGTGPSGAPSWEQIRRAPLQDAPAAPERAPVRAAAPDGRTGEQLNNDLAQLERDIGAMRNRSQARTIQGRLSSIGMALYDLSTPTPGAVQLKVVLNDKFQRIFKAFKENLSRLV